MKEKSVVIEPIKIETVKVKIVGLTPYMPEPMDMEMLERYDDKKAKKIASKDTESEEEKAKKKYYFTPDGKKGIPSRCFYVSMINVSSYIFEKSDGGKRNVREGVNIAEEILPLEYSKEEKNVTWGRTSGMNGTPRLIIRNAFHDWKTELIISYNSRRLSSDQIFNLLNWAGFHIGVGAFRKEKKGNYGLFKVEIIK